MNICGNDDMPATSDPAGFDPAVFDPFRDGVCPPARRRMIRIARLQNTGIVRAPRRHVRLHLENGCTVEVMGRLAEATARRILDAMRERP